MKTSALLFGGAKHVSPVDIDLKLAGRVRASTFALLAACRDVDSDMRLKLDFGVGCKMQVLREPRVNENSLATQPPGSNGGSSLQAWAQCKELWHNLLERAHASTFA